jgi:DNA-binding CsgD family transcriptional regulator
MNRDKLETLRQLTPRQRQILELVAEGKTNQEIADVLYISEKTVQNHRYRMCRKLGLEGPQCFVRALNFVLSGTAGWVEYEYYLSTSSHCDSCFVWIAYNG